MSKYPEKIDGPVELPIARNNITEATSDIINRLRQAIINIERAIGTNPQGSKISLSSRLSESMNEDGTIKNSAISKLNILQGPIVNSDVAQDAKIKESKLDLNYSTDYLKSSLISLEGEISNTLNAINNVTSRLNLHTNGGSSSSHTASQIDLSNSSSSPKNVTNKSIVNETVQLGIERIYDEHINFNAENINESNNSHNSDQIFYSSDAATSEVINSVKDALDFILGREEEEIKVSFAEITENSVSSSGVLKDNYSEFLRKEIVSSQPVSYSSTIDDTIEILFSGNVEAKGIEVGDFVFLKSSSIASSLRLTITSINYAVQASEIISSVFVKNTIDVDDDGTAIATITKNGKSSYNKNGLNTSFRVYSSSSSNSSVYIENPNSAAAISKNFSLPSSSSKNIKVSYESGSVEVDVFSASYNSIEYVIHALNTHFCDNNIPLSASKVQVQSRVELCISHILPNSQVFQSRPFVQISPASSDDFLSDAGFLHISDEKIYGANENSSIINGTVIRNMFYPEDITAKVSISDGLTSIESTLSSVQKLGIRKRNLIYIEHNGSSKGIFDVDNISGQTITFVNPKVFDFSKDASTKVFLIKNTISSDSLGGFGIKESYLADIFIDESGNPSISSRLNILGLPTSSGSSFVTQIRVSDLSSVGLENEKINLKYRTDKYLITTDSAGSQTGERVYAPISGYYKVPTPNNDSYVIVEVITDSSGPTSEISIDIEGFSNISSGTLLISRVLFAKDLNYFSTPSLYGNIYVASATDKRNFGSVGSENISLKAKSTEFNLPRSEINSNIVTQGLSLSGSVSTIGSESNFSLSISEGIAYINGKRIYFPEKSLSHSTSSLSELAIITANSRGEIKIDSIGSKLSEDLQKDYIVLYSLVPSQSYVTVSTESHKFRRSFKMQRGIQDLLTEVVVGTGGHFSTILQAVRYFDAIHEIKSSSESFRITLKNEEHIITESIRLGQYSIDIVGTGSDCKVKISEEMALNFSNSSSDFNIDPEVSMFRITYYNNDDVRYVNFNNVIFDYSSLNIIGSYCVLIIDRKDNLVNVTDKIISKFYQCSFIGSETLLNECGDFFMTPVALLPTKIFSGNTAYIGDLYIQNCFFRKIGSVSASGPAVFIGYEAGTVSFSDLPVDNIVVTQNIFENCTTGSNPIKIFFDGSEIDAILPSSTVSMSKNFISLSNNHYNF